MEKEFDHGIEINVKELFGVVIKKIWMSIVLAILLGAIFVTYSVYFVTPMYTSVAQILVLDGQQGGFSASDLDGLESLTNDCMYLMESKDVLQAVIDKSGLEMTPSELSSIIHISGTENTRIITVSVRHPDPVMAAKLVELIRLESKEYVAEIIRYDCMKLFGSATNPTEPSSPNIRSNAVRGAFIGFVIPLIINVAIYILNDTLVTVDDVENRLGINVIGRIPYSRKLSEKRI